jgi:hypothetical protein
MDADMLERGAEHARGWHRGRGSAERGSNGRTRAQGMNLADARGEKGREERKRSAVGRLFRPLSLLAALPTLCHGLRPPSSFLRITLRRRLSQVPSPLLLVPHSPLPFLLGTAAHASEMHEITEERTPEWPRMRPSMGSRASIVSRLASRARAHAHLLAGPASSTLQSP